MSEMPPNSPESVSRRTFSLQSLGLIFTTTAAGIAAVASCRSKLEWQNRAQRAERERDALRGKVDLYENPRLIESYKKAQVNVVACDAAGGELRSMHAIFMSGYGIRDPQSKDPDNEHLGPMVYCNMSSGALAAPIDHFVATFSNGTNRKIPVSSVGYGYFPGLAGPCLRIERDAFSPQLPPSLPLRTFEKEENAIGGIFLRFPLEGEHPFLQAGTALRQGDDEFSQWTFRKRDDAGEQEGWEGGAGIVLDRDGRIIGIPLGFSDAHAEEGIRLNTSADIPRAHGVMFQRK